VARGAGECIVRVYRVEDASGAGPYRNKSEASQRFVRAFPGNDDAHPTPEHDGLGRPAWPARFGFADLAALGHWFNGEARAFLERRGYTVRAYDAPGAVPLAHQVVFPAERARPLEPIPWSRVP
jgi:hypothetical protein